MNIENACDDMNGFSRLRYAAWLNLLIVTLFLPQRAAARPQLQASASTLVGVTDNSAGVQRGTAGATSDVFNGAGASIGLEWLRPRLTSTISYEAAINIFHRRSNQSSILQLLTGIANFILSPTARLMLLGRGQYGLMGDLDALVGSPNRSPTVVDPDPQARAAPPGTFRVFQVEGDESLEWRPSRQLLLQQVLRGFYFLPTGGDPILQRSISGTAALSLARTFPRDTLGITGQGDILNAFETQQLDGSPDRLVTAFAASFFWQNRLSPLWTTRLELGGVTFWAPDDKHTKTTPAGLASIRYTGSGSHAALIVSRGARPNTMLGDMFLTERAQFLWLSRFGNRQRWAIQADAAAQKETGTLDQAGGGISYNVFLVAATMSYNLNDNFVLAASYSFRDQETTSVPDHLANRFPSFSRNLIFISLSGQWPGQRARLERLRFTPATTMGL